MTAPVEFDPELAEALARMRAAGGDAPVLSPQTLAAARAAMALPDGGLAAAIGGRRLDSTEREVPGPPGAPDLTVLILRPRELTVPAPVIYSIHGGGMMAGNRYTELPRLVAMAEELGAIVISPEYRLAPEHRYPAGLEDCFAGLCWAAEHVGDTIIVMGGSAGGGLAAAVALLARDRGGPALAGQALLCPMIDDKNDSASTLQYADVGMWTRASNAFGWSCLLAPAMAAHAVPGDAVPGHPVPGHAVPGHAVPGYAAPARAADLAGLPPAYIEVGEAEIFRDEDVAYCAGLWRAGVSAELHVWARAYHGFDLYAPDSEVTAAALAARSSWLRRQVSRVNELPLRWDHRRHRRRHAGQRRPHQAASLFGTKRLFMPRSLRRCPADPDGCGRSRRPRAAPAVPRSALAVPRSPSEGDLRRFVLRTDCLYRVWGKITAVLCRYVARKRGTRRSVAT